MTGRVVRMHWRAGRARTSTWTPLDLYSRLSEREKKSTYALVPE